MPRIFTRAEWGARSPVRPGDQHYARWDQRLDVATHYTFGGKTQKVRSIQDYCISKGHNDIDYNALVDYRGNIYEGRIGIWLAIASHTENNNTRGIGFCFIGYDADVTDAAKTSLRWLYDEANRRKRQVIPGAAPLNMRWHSFYKPTGCPGDNLRTWVRAGMPYPAGSPGEENTMYAKFDDRTENVITLQEQLLDVDPNCLPRWGADGGYGEETTAAVKSALGDVAGDGRTYGGRQFAALQRKVAETFGGKGEKGDAGPRGLPGKTPTQVKVVMPSVAVTGDVVASE